METIDDLIRKIFQRCGYSLVPVKRYTFAVMDKSSHDYWLIIHDFQLENQAELFENIKDAFEDESFIKNISVLCIRCVEEIDLQHVDNEILEIENDPYFFKKYVLAYTHESEGELVPLIDKEFNSGKTISEVVMDKEVFKKLKEETYFGAYHLLYSIAHKLPFMTMDVSPKDFDAVADFMIKLDETKNLLVSIQDITDANAVDFIKKLIEGGE